MPPEIHVPIFSDLVPGGFSYKANYLVEFDSNSLWYETSLTIAAKALKAGVKTQYHSFMHIPAEARQYMEKLGVDLKQLESEDRFRFIDSYTPLTGLPMEREKGTLIGKPTTSLNDPSFKEKTAANIAELFRTGAIERDKRWLHIDDNTSIYNRYLKEQEVLHTFNNLALPEIRLLEISAFHSVVAGVFSDSFYKQFEAQCDGVIDFKVEENDGQQETHVRVRSLRGKSCDSRWRRLRLESTGEVAIDNLEESKKKEIGISGWLKGPKKKSG